ncbi:hypothetical protein OS493_028952 [Desmophyllum pertusum]|uniref:Peptidase S1 domain-containing protein n=1 Tax=Desmophyllum pertusum TaxID=174260 RepID=A0A9W9YWS0_9CNID|nr:hypothetical protein OS493_028952 [Desmophyllum pertusum]
MISFILLALAIFEPSFSEGCGMRPPFSRVVNGQDASPHSWPWQISLRVRGRHICGGSLIRPNWILTAAHCVYGNPNPGGYTVVVGGHRRTGTTSVQTFQVIALHKHNGFTMQNLKHDIAVLQLESNADLSDKVATVCIPDKAADLNSKCYITGWGRISGGGPAADILQQAKLPLVSNSDCRRKYGSTIDSSAHLCAGEGRSAAAGGCNGDSGGPLVCEMGGKWYLHGAVSLGGGIVQQPTLQCLQGSQVTSLGYYRK